MEFPADIANKIVGMLNVKTARPYAVLMVTEYKTAKIKKGSISPEEASDLFSEPICYENKYTLYVNIDTLDLGYDALALGFRFFNEEGRTRWLNYEPFEMYRDEVKPEFIS